MRKSTLCSSFIPDEESEDAMGMLSMLKIPVIWLMVFAVVTCAISLSFFDPTLADQLVPVSTDQIELSGTPNSLLVQPLNHCSRVDVPFMRRHLHTDCSVVGLPSRQVELLQSSDAVWFNGHRHLHAAHRAITTAI